MQAGGLSCHAVLERGKTRAREGERDQKRSGWRERERDREGVWERRRRRVRGEGGCVCSFRWGQRFKGRECKTGILKIKRKGREF